MFRFDNENRQKSVTSIGILCAVVFVLLYSIVNFEKIALLFKGIFGVLSPVIIGAAIAYMLNPLLKLYEHHILKKMKPSKGKRSLALLLTYIVSFGIIFLSLYLLVPQIVEAIVDLVTNFDVYIGQTAVFINNLLVKITSNSDMADFVDPSALTDAITDLFVQSETALEGIFTYIEQYGQVVINSLKNIVLGIFISIYMLGSKERLFAQFRKGCTALLGNTKTNSLRKYLRLANHTVGDFFVGKIVDSFIIFLITLAALMIFKIPYALLVSVIVGITNIIPVFGPFLGAIPSAFIIFIRDPKSALIFVVLILIIQQLDGNVIGPKILGESTGLSSLGVILSIIIMGAYFGIIGMIIGVPVFSMIVVMIKQYVETRLRAKKLPVDTEDYYAADSDVDPNAKREKFFNKLIASSRKIFNRIFKRKE